MLLCACSLRVRKCVPFTSKIADRENRLTNQWMSVAGGRNHGTPRRKGGGARLTEVLHSLTQGGGEFQRKKYWNKHDPGKILWRDQIGFLWVTSAPKGFGKPAITNHTSSSVLWRATSKVRVSRSISPTIFLASLIFGNTSRISLSTLCVKEKKKVARGICSQLKKR